MTEDKIDDTSPLSRPLAVADVPPEGVEVEIVASEREREALAMLNALPALPALSATLTARRWRGDGLEVSGELRARVRQTCVLTLEEFQTDVSEPIDLRFAPPREAPRPHSRRRQPEPEPESAEHALLGEDPPDPLIGGVVDLGAVVSEYLTLALDPYPRKPGAEFVEPSPEADSDAVSPFSALRRIRREPPAGG